MAPATGRRMFAAGVVVGIAVLFFAGGGYTWIRADGNVEELLTESGIVGPIVFLAVMWLTQPLGIPGFVYMAPAGIVWPFPVAIALCWIGNMGASYLAFAFARWFAREWVTERIPPRIGAYSERLETGGLRPVVLLRLVFGQLPPADWMLGVTKVSTRTFLVGTGIGIIPGVVLFVVAGGGILEALSDVPTGWRRAAFAAMIAFAVGRRVRLRRRRAQSEAGESITPGV